ncbi:gluconate 2-dehydrogenase subunit 3 family protein [Maribacter sp. UBA3344]|uniref:gluconate 2-dehydrogenase subunit 3 family protein n=1 Tax=Maribacter sp. UBA3344 TaxID=1946803 RepID=UPI0025795C77|nr:gluconate 2-dehydrogenase subunit 3 family protein [Maribacter sp. UBA3344]|tara:strand:+ start:1039 stop:1758 length:720 start_codon:yes stop_codon:yes gene_type:complete
MDRRNSIKSIILGSVAGGLAVHGRKPEDEVKAEKTEMLQGYSYKYGRTPKEKELILELEAEQFFNEHELETIAALRDLILPASDEFGSATDAGVPDFIEFMTKDIPEMQTTLRGGLMWLDHKSNTEFGTEFKTAIEGQQKQIVDAIAYPDINIPEGERPLEIQFFSLMRNLTLTGYYTSKVGIANLGYKGNTPNVWDGVPEDVLKQHGVAYEKEWLSKCVDQSKRGVMAEWDDKGNLLT